MVRIKRFPSKKAYNQWYYTYKVKPFRAKIQPKGRSRYRCMMCGFLQSNNSNYLRSVSEPDVLLQYKLDRGFSYKPLPMDNSMKLHYFKAIHLFCNQILVNLELKIKQLEFIIVLSTPPIYTSPIYHNKPILFRNVHTIIKPEVIIDGRKSM